jgi:NAD(P)H dehydrogenase (quinone)
MTRPARIAVVYYSATGNVHRLAHALAEGAGGEGAEPVATLEDLEWADGVAFGTPTRFGNVAAQLKQFMDQAGRLWQEGRLADKVATAFTASMTTHGGQESTILALSNTLYHWGMLILPLGYTASEVFNAGGNPYGTSYTSGKRVEGPDENALAVARYQGQRLSRYAAVVAAAREADAFRVKRPRPERFQAAALD